jgi:DNA modification methylase
MATRLNKLTGKEWLENSFSIWSDIKKNEEERKLGHPAMFPIVLVKKLLKIFTNDSQVKILDPFVGSGSTIIAANQLGHIGIGFDINEKYLKMARERLDFVYRGFDNSSVPYHLFNRSASEVFPTLKDNKLLPIDMCITSPPYWDILNRKRTADYKPINKYSNLETDFGNESNYAKFLLLIKKSFLQVFNSLRTGGKCIVVVMDLRKGPFFYEFHTDISQQLKSVGFSLNDIIIWNRQKEYNNMRPLGFPYKFIVNKIHEYILIFEKKDGHHK